MQGNTASSGSDGSQAQHDPYIGTLPKFPLARKESEKAQKKAGGTMLGETPRHGPWLDDRYGGPSTTGKKDGCSVTKCGQNVYLVRIHRSARKQRFHPLQRSAPVDAKFLTGERIREAFYREGRDVAQAF